MTEHKCETPGKCLIQAGHATTTLAYYAPIYDGHGRNVNPDRNTTTSHMKCWTCKKEWVENSAPPADVPLLTDQEIGGLWTQNDWTPFTFAKAIEATVRRKAGL